MVVLISIYTYTCILGLGIKACAFDWVFSCGLLKKLFQSIYCISGSILESGKIEINRMYFFFKQIAILESKAINVKR